MGDLHGVLHNFHLVAIPMTEKHTGEYMFLLISALLDAISSNWRSKLIACSTDGASNNLGNVRGVMTRLANVCLPGFHRIWCGIHQLDLIVKKAIKSLMNDSFIKELTNFTNFLCRQYNFIAEVGSKFVDTRWIGLRRILTWAKSNHVAILNYYSTKPSANPPSPLWWTLAMCLESFLDIVEETIGKLQGKQMLLQVQKNLITQCIESLDDDITCAILEHG